MTDWRPIETAPMPAQNEYQSDRFLASDYEGPARECYSHSNGWIYSTDEKHLGPIRPNAVKGEGRPDDRWQPIKWMPLPEPPKDD